MLMCIDRQIDIDAHVDVDEDVDVYVEIFLSGEERANEKLYFPYVPPDIFCAKYKSITCSKRIDAWKRQRGDSQVASKMKVAERKHRCLSH